MYKNFLSSSCAICLLPVLFKRKQGFLAVHSEKVVPIHHLGGGVHHRFQTAAVAADQLVGALHSQVTHGIGILHHQGVHGSVLQAVHRGHVGVKAHQEDPLGQAQLLQEQETVCGPGRTEETSARQQEHARGSKDTREAAGTRRRQRHWREFRSLFLVQWKPPEGLNFRVK